MAMGTAIDIRSGGRRVRAVERVPPQHPQHHLAHAIVGVAQPLLHKQISEEGVDGQEGGGGGLRG